MLSGGSLKRITHYAKSTHITCIIPKLSCTRFVRPPHNIAISLMNSRAKSPEKTGSDHANPG